MAALRHAWGLGWTLGSACLVALAGCVPGELFLSGGDAAGTDGKLDAPSDTRATDRGETADGSHTDAALPEGGHDDGMAPDGMPPLPETGPRDAGPLPLVKCGDAATCSVPPNECCVHRAPFTFVCQSASLAATCTSDGNTPVFCANATDCPGEVCCGTKSSPTAISYEHVECEPTCTSSDNTKIVFCDPSAMLDVCTPLGKSCMASTLLPFFYVCG